MGNNKEEYRTHCERERSIPLYAQSWWLDLTAGAQNWDVILVKKGDAIQASLPYVTHKKHKIFSLLGQPPLTQSLGPWLVNNGGSYTKQLSDHKRLMEEIIAGLPKFHIFNQSFSTVITNWLPFYWKGYTQTTRYTYILEKLNPEDLLQKIQKNIRNYINKARDRYDVTTHKVDVVDDPKIDDFILLIELVYRKQNRKLPCTKEFLKKIINGCFEKQQGALFIAYDPESTPHAGSFVIRDYNTAYYILGGGNPDLRKSGATSLCLFEAINDSFTLPNIEIFDFEGSMNPSIERFFRGFGAVQTPYFRIEKTNSRALRILRTIKSLRN